MKSGSQEGLSKITQAMIDGREKLGWSQAQLAAHLHVHPTRISQIERGIGPLPEDWYPRLPDCIRHRVVYAHIARLLGYLGFTESSA